MLMKGIAKEAVKKGDALYHKAFLFYKADKSNPATATAAHDAAAGAPLEAEDLLAPDAKKKGPSLKLHDRALTGYKPPTLVPTSPQRKTKRSNAKKTPPKRVRVAGI